MEGGDAFHVLPGPLLRSERLRAAATQRATKNDHRVRVRVRVRVKVRVKVRVRVRVRVRV